MIFYIADTHFNHENILKLDARPFGDVDEMDETIINNLNSCVSGKDTVYVLGDAFWGKEDKSIEIMNRLCERFAVTEEAHMELLSKYNMPSCFHPFPLYEPDKWN